jgi:predicted phosphohydrolase
MKFRILSDLHLEYSSKVEFSYIHCGEDAVILAGDIGTSSKNGRSRLNEFLGSIPRGVQVFSVNGNHDYYAGSYHRVNDYHKSLENVYPNYTFLLDESVIYNDIEIFGGTMFTDMLLHGYNPLFDFHVKSSINDFEWITMNDRGNFRRWMPDDHKKAHEKFKSALENWLSKSEGKKRIVITHFVPTSQAIHEMYKNDKLNPYFAVNMEKYMGWKGMWVAGHTHSSWDGYIGDTRVIINPKGYHSENKSFIEDLIIEV